MGAFQVFSSERFHGAVKDCILRTEHTHADHPFQPRNLPTARLTPASSLSALSPLSESMSIPIPSPHPHSHRQSFIALGPLLFEFSRLLSIVPALFGTLWNLYHVWRPPNGSWGWRAEYAVSVLWVSAQRTV